MPHYRPIRDMRPERNAARSFSQTADVTYAPRPLPKQRPKPATTHQRAEQLPRTEDLPETPSKRGNGLLIPGIGMCAGLLLLMFAINVLLPWWNALQTQWHYGDSHASHFDYHGHHFMGEVYRGFVTVYDIPDGHPEKSRVFMLQSAQDNAVIAFEVQDVNHDGIQDVTIGIEGSPIGITLYGTKDGSYSKTPPENK